MQPDNKHSKVPVPYYGVKVYYLTGFTAKKQSPAKKRTALFYEDMEIDPDR